MTYAANCTLPSELFAQIASERLACLPELLRTIINTAMQVERQAVGHLIASLLFGPAEIC